MTETKPIPLTVTFLDKNGNTVPAYCQSLIDYCESIGYPIRNLELEAFSNNLRAYSHSLTQAGSEDAHAKLLDTPVHVVPTTDGKTIGVFASFSGSTCDRVSFVYRETTELPAMGVQSSPIVEVTGDGYCLNCSMSTLNEDLEVIMNRLDTSNAMTRLNNVLYTYNIPLVDDEVEALYTTLIAVLREFKGAVKQHGMPKGVLMFPDIYLAQVEVGNNQVATVGATIHAVPTNGDLRFYMQSVLNIE